MTIHIALIGEQSMPILLATTHLNAARTVLVHTERTKPVAERLHFLISAHKLNRSIHELAQSMNVAIIELIGYRAGNGLPTVDQLKLRVEIAKYLGNRTDDSH